MNKVFASLATAASLLRRPLSLVILSSSMMTRTQAQRPLLKKWLLTSALPTLTSMSISASMNVKRTRQRFATSCQLTPQT